MKGVFTTSIFFLPHFTRYGDFVPTTELSRIIMAFWSLAGLVLVGIFGGVVASGLSVGTLDNDIKIYGSTVFIYLHQLILQ